MKNLCWFPSHGLQQRGMTKECSGPVLYCSRGYNHCCRCWSGGLTHRFSSLFIQDLQWVAQSILTPRPDSLAALVLSNWQGFDSLTAERGGLCLFLWEECCFLVTHSGIVKEKIRQLQTDLHKNIRNSLIPLTRVSLAVHYEIEYYPS